MTLERVAPDCEPTPSMALTTSMPSVTCPKTTCFPSNQAVSAVQRKNWDPLVPGPLQSRIKKVVKEKKQLVSECVGRDGNQNRCDVEILNYVRVSHAQDSGSSVLEFKVLILELAAVDGLSSGTVVVGEISTLAHKTRNDTVERRTSEAESLFSSAKSAEVFGSLGNNITEL